MGNKKRKGGGQALGGLADALVKAGVASEKQAERAVNARRREHKELGADGIAERQREQQAQFRDERAAAAGSSREANRTQADVATVERAHRLVREHHESGGGNRRWFFVARDARILFVDVSEAVQRKLGDGDAGVVETLGAVKGEHTVLSDRHALTALAEFEPEVVRFWNRGSRRS